MRDANAERQAEPRSTTPSVTCVASKLAAWPPPAAGGTATVSETSHGPQVITSAMAFWTVETQEVANSFTYGGNFITQYPLDVLSDLLRTLLVIIPLAFVNPRASRSVNLIFAVFAYMVYSNLLSIVKAWVAQGRVQFEFGWWVLHAAMLGLIAFLFLWRNTLGFKLWLRR